MKPGRKSWKEKMNQPFDLYYGTIYGKYSKYKRGDVIKDLDTLLKQKQIIFAGRFCKNIAWVESQQIRMVLKGLNLGWFHLAVLKEKGESNEETNTNDN